MIGPPRLYAMVADRPRVRVELFGHAAPPIAIPHRPVGAALCAGFFSSISPHKGLHVLLDAISNIPQETGMTFTVCGPPGPDASYVREMTARMAGDARIAFKPGVPHDEIGAEMAKADVVVVPSLWDENNPLVLLDALEAGRYVVASSSPGMIDAIDPPHGGVCVPPGEAGDLADALLRLARDPAPIRAVRERPVRRPQFDRYIEAIEARYAAALEQRRGGARPAQ